jgi:hypothetical protein
MGKAILFVRSTAALALDMRPASHADIAAIMRLERMPGYELCVGRSEEAEHRAMLASAAYAYRVGVDPDGATQAPRWPPAPSLPSSRRDAKGPCPHGAAQG